jgi:hypothetical protein
MTEELESLIPGITIDMQPNSKSRNRLLYLELVDFQQTFLGNSMKKKALSVSYGRAIRYQFEKLDLQNYLTTHVKIN